MDPAIHTLRARSVAIVRAIGVAAVEPMAGSVMAGCASIVPMTSSIRIVDTMLELVRLPCFMETALEMMS